MTNKKIIILGAGITGRMAKLLLEEAFLYEKQSNSSTTINAAYGPNYLKTPIEILQCSPVVVNSTIDDNAPSYKTIKNYKIKKCSDLELLPNEVDKLTYGDIKQFQSVQTEYTFNIPLVKVNYNCSVTSINLHDKLIKFKDTTCVHYDILIITIPLILIMKLIGLSELYPDDSAKLGFFKHRPIYIRTEHTNVYNNEVHINYITDSDNPFYRVTKYKKFIFSESLYKIKNSVKLYPGKIYSNKFTVDLVNDLKDYDVHCFGRYSTWDTNENIHQTYNKLTKFVNTYKGGNYVFKFKR